MKNNQRNIDNIVSKILRETLEKKADEVMEKIKSKSSEGRALFNQDDPMDEMDFDYETSEGIRLVNGFDPMDEMSEGSMCSECGGKMYEGECMECGSMYEGEMDLDEFSDEFDYVETDEDVDEGNAFTGALVKAKEKGDDEFTVDGKKYQVKESIQLSEDELIDVIEKLVVEELEKSNISKGTKPPGLTNYEKATKGSKKENDDYIKSVTKKLKEYLKNGSQGEYSMDPKIFPAGNGELKKMSKKAYTPSDTVKDYVDNFTAAGQENIVYDEIHPDEDWVSDNIEGSSRTGNNPEWANAVKTPTNEKRNKIRQKNLLGALKKQAYNKSPQPVVTDQTGDASVKPNKIRKSSNSETNNIFSQLESTNKKNEKLIKEEFKKIERLMNYNKKTQ